MRILAQKTYLKFLVVITISSVILLSCKDENKVVQIIGAVSVEGTGYVYSDESVYKDNKGKEYSLRYKAQYVNGKINKLLVYKSEGVLEYDVKDINSDKKILNYYNLPKKQKFTYINNCISDSKEKCMLASTP